jgi:hypothetical protein
MRSFAPNSFAENVRRQILRTMFYVGAGLAAMSQAFAVTLYAYDSTNSQIVSFASETPATFITNVAVSGLGGDQLKAISFRPVTGELYGLVIPLVFGSSRLVKIDPVTGVTTNVGNGPTLSTSTQTPYGMAFDPVHDEIRVVSGSSNFRLSPGTGALLADDGELAYAATDPRVGQGVLVPKLAYSNTFAGAVSQTTAYVIDSGLSGPNLIDVLATLGSQGGNPVSASTGTLFSIAALDFHSASYQGGFVVDPKSGTGLAVFRQSSNSYLNTINLTTGASQRVGQIGNGTNLIIGLAVAPIPALSACLDLDGDGTVQPLTDGLLLLRALFGLTGTAVTNAALPNPAPPRSTWSSIRAHMNGNCGMNFAP